MKIIKKKDTVFITSSYRSGGALFTKMLKKAKQLLFPCMLVQNSSFKRQNAAFFTKVP